MNPVEEVSTVLLCLSVWMSLLFVQGVVVWVRILDIFILLCCLLSPNDKPVSVSLTDPRVARDDYGAQGPTLRSVITA